jgi:hypothetical protein
LNAMPFDQKTRNLLKRTVAACRGILDVEFTSQLQELYGIQPTGALATVESLTHLGDEQREAARLLRDRLAHLDAGEGGTALDPDKARPESVARIIREQAFTVLNRLAALRLCEERGLVLECVRRGENSEGFQLFLQSAGGALGEQFDTYVVYLGCLFDELAIDLGALFDRFSALGLIFPRRDALAAVLAELNGTGGANKDCEFEPEQFAAIWSEDEAIGWIYQYYNDEAERKKMRKDSPAPRNSRELAVRNQFFTPRYVVEFLTDNTLGRLWYEMTRGETVLRDRCRYLVRRPIEIFLKEGEAAPENATVSAVEVKLSQEVLLRMPVHILHRPLKDPRNIRVLDPACGSMHFGIYAFDLIEIIYAEAWDIAHSANTLKSVPDFAPFVIFVAQFDRETFLREVPRLIIEHNIHGIDIDPRAAQIAGLSLWMRAQRTWHQAGIKRADRPRITRSNIVCAEPMPGEKEMLRNFVEGAFRADERPAFAYLLEKIFDRMTLAGEAGSLLRIEEEIRAAVADARALALRQSAPRQGALFAGAESPEREEFDLRGLTDEQFWENAEGRIYEALATYAGQAENGGFRRRLFADDAAQGFAFIDICRKDYDVMVMNPPFGAFSRGSKQYAAETFPDSANDIFAAFVECSLKRLNEHGLLGAITSRTGFFIASFADWRREILLREARLLCFADLGGGVMDNATVEAAAYVMKRSTTGLDSTEPTPYLRFLVQADKQPFLAAAIDGFKQGSSPIAGLFWAAHDQFALLPDAPFVYWVHAKTLRKLSKCPRFEPAAAQVRKGLRTGDNFRFVRALWEIPPEAFTPGVVAADPTPRKEHSYWVPLVLSGSSQPWFSPLIVALNWRHNGRELRQYVTKYGSPSRLIQAEDFYFRPGISWTRRAARFIPYAIPSGCIPTGSRPMAFPERGKEFISLAITASRTASEFMRFYGDWFTRPNFLEGKVKLAPWPEISEEIKVLLCSYVRSECDSRRRAYRGHEPFFDFIKPFTLDSGDESANVTIAWNTLLGTEREQIVEEAFGLTPAETSDLGSDLDEALSIRGIESESEDNDEDDEGAELVLEVSPRSHFDAVVSYVLGCVFGRWDIRNATGDRPEPELPDPFAPLSVCPPGMLRGADGLPLSPDEGRQLVAMGQYPLDVAWDGILVDDQESPLDVDRRVREALAVLFGSRADVIAQEACTLLGANSLRDWFRKPAGFFAEHLARYTKSKRKAPIYWPLSTAGGTYTLWLYYPRLTSDTLFCALKQFVEPKLFEIEKALGHLRALFAAEESGARERRQLEELETLRRDLSELRAELEAWAPRWKPNLNDGVLITASPLWKLFRHPKWRKDLEACWREVERGAYDWSHLALTLRPNEVREKCKSDRSLAIAHGLEELCEVEPPKPKTRRRAKPDAALKEREAKKEALREELAEALSMILLGEKIPLDVTNTHTGEVIIPANRKITKALLRKVASAYDQVDIAPSPISKKIREIIAPFEAHLAKLQLAEQQEMAMEEQ